MCACFVWKYSCGSFFPFFASALSRISADAIRVRVVVRKWLRKGLYRAVLKKRFITEAESLHRIKITLANVGFAESKAASVYKNGLERAYRDPQHFAFCVLISSTVWWFEYVVRFSGNIP